MAHQKLGNGSDTEIESDIAVVSPVEMGKGLLWDSATNTYYVALDDRTFEWDEQLGRLKLRVSALEDNQLKVRDDGLYQGNTARPDLANLFVANHGNDNNPGTREAPLRTIQAAIDKLEDIPAYYHIWLHEGDDFEWVYSHKSFARVIINVYGASVDSTFPISTPKNPHYRGYTAKNFPRPTINVRVKDVNGVITREFLRCQEATIRGVKIAIHNKFEGYDDGSKPGSFTGIFDATDSITIHGCIIDEVTKGVSVGSGLGAYRDDVLLRGPRILWIDSLSKTLPNFATSSYTTQISLISWNQDRLMGLGDAPDHEALIKSATAFQDMSRGMKEKISSVIFDDTTKSVFGMNLNWDIFANS
ncbi:hypothetical protein ACLQ91_02040 [Avibacterium endocarditidis]|uniref:hypothetical protein n=1 Tax=Avibacterium endocarditidis TaxID=380674 RepID=UPI0039FC0604